MTDRAGIGVLPAILSALLLVGCAGMQPSPAPGGAVPPFPLLPPNSYGGRAQVSQTLSAAYGEREVTLQCYLDVAPEILTVLCLTAGGQRVFTLKYDGVNLESERSPFAPSDLPPERVLADLELSFWPLPALQQATAGSAWSITEPRPGLRRVRHGATLVAETHSAGEGAWPARLWFSSFAYGYALDIRSQPPAP